MKKLIRLTESDLHRIVRESVKRIMQEEDWKSPLKKAKGNRQDWNNVKKIHVEPRKKPNKIENPTFGDKFGDVFKKLKK